MRCSEHDDPHRSSKPSLGLQTGCHFARRPSRENSPPAAPEALAISLALAVEPPCMGKHSAGLPRPRARAGALPRLDFTARCLGAESGQSGALQQSAKATTSALETCADGL
jgi:hypothetical protein